ncbi:hypothetical protein QFZ56_005169 [Streptomyces achromogenes]|uniref:Uncharacterized protein n=1 Tax=Streptomyces achromogenes TaxID=67255 RepID=A0ABU0Q747_STRAH|nr:hypothetical protein [Streptomyces achromogenes]MDQ0686206.1 hypothetical protein [Streptomyces achromogenes]
MNERETLRELLGRAVDTVEAPVGRGGDSVFARAAALRRRRRTAVTGAVAAVVAGGVVLGPGLLPDGTGGQDVTAAGTGSAGTGTGASGFAKLLPAGVGKVHEVTLTQVFGWRTSAMSAKGAGPYDGDYAVARDGGVGYVTVRLHDKAKVAGPASCADGYFTKSEKDCTSVKVPGAGLLSIWKVSGSKADKESDSWLEARLVRDDGTLLLVQDWMGTQRGPGKEGPPLKTYPLTKAQLRQLALNPALLP